MGKGSKKIGIEEFLGAARTKELLEEKSVKGEKELILLKEKLKRARKRTAIKLDEIFSEVNKMEDKFFKILEEAEDLGVFPDCEEMLLNECLQDLIAKRKLTMVKLEKITK